MDRNNSFKISLGLFLALGSAAFAEAAHQHPHIWITAGERPALLEKIAKNEWAAGLVDDLHKNVDAAVEKHAADPSALLKTIPEFGSQKVKYNHYNTLAQAADSAILFYLTEEDTYARFAADILNIYIRELADQEPGTMTITGEQESDQRWVYPQLALAYDFIHSFLTRPGMAEKLPFDNAVAQKVFHNIAVMGVAESSGPDPKRAFTNHAILKTRGTLFPILCVEDDAERERLFQIYWNTGTRATPSFNGRILPKYGRQGIWPESTSVVIGN